MSTVAEIIFQVTPCAETGGYVARWDAPHADGGITTRVDSFAELDAMNLKMQTRLIIPTASHLPAAGRDIAAIQFR